MGAKLMSNYFDILLQIQQDCADNLNSESAFQHLPALLFRKTVIASDISKRMPHLTGKNGKVGCGILVCMPTISGEDPNVQPPQGDILLPFWCVSQEEINYQATGTGISAEAAALMVRAYIHQFSLRGQVELYQDQRAIEPLPGIEQLYPGCVGYQFTARGKMADPQLSIVPNPTLAENSPLQITLACSITEVIVSYSTNGNPIYAAVAIYYTTDGSFPGPGNSTGTATLYTAPFTVPAGTVVAFKAYAPGWRGSDVIQQLISS
jgi:hypothetical protein